MTDERILLERVKECDEAALGELYDRYAPLVYAYIFRRVSDAHLAEDLTADVFVRVIQAVQAERFWNTSFTAWLYRIAHNLVVDHYRQRSETGELALNERWVAGEHNPAAAVDQRYSYEQLSAALRRLTPEQQQVLTLRFGEGMTAREVAKVINKTTGAIEALQHRALNALRRILEGETE